MQLIGMLDSPYVRRVAISLQLLGLPFEHRSISVFRTFDTFREINPVVKAPTLVCDDGTVLMDSTLILDYAEALAAPRASLMPRALADRLHCLRLLGLALAACEKAVQIVYERHQRPPERQHEPWVERVRGQLHAAVDGLEDELQRRPLLLEDKSIDQAGVTCAVTWKFIEQMVAGEISASRIPALSMLSTRAEVLPAFAAAPYGPATVDPAISMRSAS